jgi:hypothetical protein
MSIYLAEDRENSFAIGHFKNIGYLYFRRKTSYMRPDYSHKIFGDKRLHHFFFQEALARASAFA